MIGMTVHPDASRVFPKTKSVGAKAALRRQVNGATESTAVVKMSVVMTDAERMNAKAAGGTGGDETETTGDAMETSGDGR